MSWLCFGDLHLIFKVAPGLNLLNLCQKLFVCTISYAPIGSIPRSTSYGVYISQLIRFARVSGHVADFNARNKSLTAKLLQQGYRYHKLWKTFSNFYHRHYELVLVTLT